MNMKAKKLKKQKNRQFQDYAAQQPYVSTSAICNLRVEVCGLHGRIHLGIFGQ